MFFDVQANELAYCFAVAKGDKLNIIGRKFFDAKLNTSFSPSILIEFL